MKWGKEQYHALVLVRGSMEKVNSAIPRFQELAEYEAGTEEVFKADLFSPAVNGEDSDKDPPISASESEIEDAEEYCENEEPSRKRQRMFVNAEKKKLQILKKNNLLGDF